MTAYPLPTPPFSKPVGGLVAQPANWPVYSIPGSHLLDAAYASQLNPGYPFPRQPRAYESETRAGGTGLIWGPQTISTAPSVPTPATPGSSPWCGNWTPWNPGSC